MIQGESDLLERLVARLDAQEAKLQAQDAQLAELAALRAKVTMLEAGAAPVAPTPPGVPAATPAAPSARPTPSRRALLKGAGAALFTTALLATGEVIPVAPYRVAAAGPYAAQTGGDAPRAAAAPDTLYQSFVGTDFQPETTANGYNDLNTRLFSGAYQAGQIDAAAAPAHFSARLDLPQGATITEMLFYVILNDGNYMAVDLAGYTPNGNYTGLGGTSVNPISPSVQTVTIPLSGPSLVVDNATYSYVIRWIAYTAGTTQQLYGARVAYTLPGSAQVYGNAQTGIGVSGASASGTGVYGISTTGNGLFGGASASGTGVQGVSASGIGLIGQGDNAAGAGVKGVSGAGMPAVGAVKGTGAATNIHAGVTGFGTAGPGTQGQSQAGHGAVGLTTATDGQHAATLGYVYPGGNAIGVRGSVPAGATGLAGVFDGDVTINGALRVFGSPKNAAVKHPTDNSYRLLYCMESPESWFEDFGRAKLVNGAADVKLDPDFAALVHAEDYHVFLTEYEDHSSLYVTKVSATGFTVQAKETAPGGPKAPTKAGGTFSWRVVAKRKDIAGERLAKVAAPPPPPPVTQFAAPETPAATQAKKP